MKKRYFTIRVTDETFERIAAKAAAQHIGTSEAARLMIEAGLATDDLREFEIAKAAAEKAISITLATAIFKTLGMVADMAVMNGIDPEAKLDKSRAMAADLYKSI